MITDDELRVLLDGAAHEFPPPAEAPDRVLAAARAGGVSGDRSGGDQAAPPPTTPGGRRRPRSPRRRLLVAAAAVVVVAGGLSFIFGHAADDADTREPTAVGDRSSADGGVFGEQLESADEAAPEAAGSAIEPDRAGDAVETPTTGVPVPSRAGAGEQAPLPGPAPGGAKLIKIANLELLVGEGKVAEAFDRLTTLAVGSGGVVADQQTQELGDRPSGTITLRVPAAAFEDTLAKARQLGEVQSAATTAEDVTGEYTDIEGRLRTLVGERDQLRLLLTEATSIGDILSVRDRITEVQTEIEQLEGRKQVLDDRVTLATITVSVEERSEDDDDGPILDDGPEEQSGFSGAWDDAVDGFNEGLQSLIAGSGQALLVLLCAGVLALMARGFWRYGRRRLV